LDKTIKVWDVNALSPSSAVLGDEEDDPSIVINTTYPVWRARDLPFGRGVLSLPQRGETALEMFAHSDSEEPIELFEGHEDVVKEFVWRRGISSLLLHELFRLKGTQQLETSSSS
jgi:hypothetical protein